jgi:hypothetical protein
MKKLFILAAFVGAMAIINTAGAQEPQKNKEAAKTEKCEKKCDKATKDCCKNDKAKEADKAVKKDCCKKAEKKDAKSDCCKEKK